MPRPFYHVTAEQVIAAVEATTVRQNADASFVETFCDFPASQAADALEMAADLGLVTKSGAIYLPAGPLARLTSTPDEKQKAAILRIVLEMYEPFVCFRDRLLATQSTEVAARQTKQLLDLTSHHEHVKDTLISLGTYTNALRVERGGRYKVESTSFRSHLEAISNACVDSASSESFIRAELGAAADHVDRIEVLLALANALRKAETGDSSDAVTEAGNAVESYVAALAGRLGVSLAGASGIGQKLDKFRTGNHLPKKLVEAGKYLAQVRNAADHGIDVDVGAAWKVQQSTALNYVRVACSLIRACHERENGGAWII